MPTHDWQFWVATMIALGAGVVVVRMVVPAGVWSRVLGRRQTRGKRASLTVEGKSVGKGRGGSGR